VAVDRVEGGCQVTFKLVPFQDMGVYRSLLFQRIQQWMDSCGSISSSSRLVNISKLFEGPDRRHIQAIIRAHRLGSLARPVLKSMSTVRLSKGHTESPGITTCSPPP
jgi:hypothetical protein